MNVFVTGANGFVGRELLLQLRENNISYVAVDLVQNAKLGVLVADVRLKEINSLIPERADAVIHLAALTRDSDCKNRASECFDANVMTTLNLINACEMRQVKQFIFASSEWVYGEWKDSVLVKDALTPIDSMVLGEYAFSKFVSEVNLHQKYKHGFCPVTMLRFGIIYGPREKNWSAVESLFNAVRVKDEVRVGSLRTGRCFIHVKDIVSGILASFGLQGNHTLDLQGPQFVTLGDIIDISKRMTGRSPKVVETAVDNFNVRNISNQNTFSQIQWRPEYGIEKGLTSLL